MKKITIVYSEPVNYFPESVWKEFEKDEEKKIKEKIKMTYEEAKEKALKINPKFNACKEYKIAYYFYDKHDKTFEDSFDDDEYVEREVIGWECNVGTDCDSWVMTAFLIVTLDDTIVVDEKREFLDMRGEKFYLSIEKFSKCDIILIREIK